MNIPKIEGGVFHTRKVKYSPETAAFLKELINESKLSMMYRKKINNSISNGEPIPLPEKLCRSRTKKPEPEELEENIDQILKRRKMYTIKQSGAYDPLPFVPDYKKEFSDKEKKRFQDLMAFGKTISDSKLRESVKEKLEVKEMLKEEEMSREKLFVTTLSEIKERADFLKKMETMGKRKEYKNLIDQQIWEKLRLLEKLDPELFATVKDYFNITNTMRNDSEGSILPQNKEI